MDEDRTETYAAIEREVRSKLQEIFERTRADNPDDEAIMNIFEAENAKWIKMNERILAEKELERMAEEALNRFVLSGEATKVGDTYVKRQPN